MLHCNASIAKKLGLVNPLFCRSAFLRGAANFGRAIDG
jgi:hypothetical protein